jgi:hypothetical protein
MNEEFRKDWLEACEKFTIIQHTVTGIKGMNYVCFVHAEADTGSRYEFIGVEIPRWDGEMQLALVVKNPWERVWTCSWGPIYPDYAIEHWGSPRQGRNMHGGDAAALTIGLNILCGDEPDVAVAFCKDFAKEG